MVSLAITRRKTCFSNHSSMPVRSCYSLSSFGHGEHVCDPDTKVATNVAERCPNEDDITWRRWPQILNSKEEFMCIHDQRLFQLPYDRFCIPRFGNGRREFVLPFAARGLAQSIHTASAAKVCPPEKNDEEEHYKDWGQKD